MGDQEKNKGPRFRPYDPSENARQRRREIHKLGGDIGSFEGFVRAIQTSDPDMVNAPTADDLAKAFEGEKPKESEDKVLAEIAYKDPLHETLQRKARLVKDAHYYRLQIGHCNPNQPDSFQRSPRCLTFNEEEALIIKELLSSIPAKQER